MNRRRFLGLTCKALLGLPAVTLAGEFARWGLDEPVQDDMDYIAFVHADMAAELALLKRARPVDVSAGFAKWLEAN